MIGGRRYSLARGASISALGGRNPDGVQMLLQAARSGSRRESCRSLRHRLDACLRSNCKRCKLRAPFSGREARVKRARSGKL